MLKCVKIKFSGMCLRRKSSERTKGKGEGFEGGAREKLTGGCTDGQGEEGRCLTLNGQHELEQHVSQNT